MVVGRLRFCSIHLSFARCEGVYRAFFPFLHSRSAIRVPVLSYTRMSGNRQPNGVLIPGPPTVAVFVPYTVPQSPRRPQCSISSKADHLRISMAAQCCIRSGHRPRFLALWTSSTSVFLSCRVDCCLQSPPISQSLNQRTTGCAVFGLRAPAIRDLHDAGGVGLGLGQQAPRLGSSAA